MEYAPFAGLHVIEEIHRVAADLQDKRMLFINSTFDGGGVAEILNRMIPFMNDLNLSVRWEVIKGNDAFFSVTKKIHNALHGGKDRLTPEEYAIFEEIQRQNLAQMSLDEEIVFIHDPQPVGLVERKKRNKNYWVWRCHIDLSNPNPEVWNYLKDYVNQYDASVFSAPAFRKKLDNPQFLISPSIDPLSEKNREMSMQEINNILGQLQIPTDKPLVTQVSRFDRLKDPVGVIQAFKNVKNNKDAYLLLVGGSASDDPEGAQVLAEVLDEAAHFPNILVRSLPPTSHLEINAIQRASTIILQKSLREGFGLTITEALWKAKPVIAGAVGGIPLQITHGQSGILTQSVKETTYWIERLLDDPNFASKLGLNGREHVRKNFLITRHIRDYLLLFLFVSSGKKREDFDINKSEFVNYRPA